MGKSLRSEGNEQLAAKLIELPLLEKLLPLSEGLHTNDSDIPTDCRKSILLLLMQAR